MYPIREALRQLSAEGALEILENRRVMVPKMTAMKFAELVEARICLETHSAVRAMPYIDETRLAQLEELDSRIDIASETGNSHDVTRYNQQFHRLLYTANPHQVTQSLIESLWLQLAPFMQVASENLDGPLPVVFLIALTTSLCMAFLCMAFLCRTSLRTHFFADAA